MWSYLKDLYLINIYTMTQNEVFAFEACSKQIPFNLIIQYMYINCCHETLLELYFLSINLAFKRTANCLDLIHAENIPYIRVFSRLDYPGK